MPSLCKHHVDTADAKRPKHHLDTSRKPPKPQTKKLFHVTFGMQTPSGHCRCKKTQTPSGHAPKTAQTASQKTVSRHLWNPHKTSFGATEHMPSLCTIWTLQMQKDPNTIWTRAENRPNRKPKNCFTIWTRAENRPNRKPKNAFTSPLEAT